MHNLILISIWFSYFIFSLGLIQIGVMIVQFIVAFFAFSHEEKKSMIVQHILEIHPEFSYTISIIIPAYNEALTLPKNINNLLVLNYPNYEIIVVNDGSNDTTLSQLITDYELKPTTRYFEQALPHQEVKCLYQSARYTNLWVVDKENGGKADALNAGINVSRSDLFCVIDADSILEVDSLKKVIRPFFEHPESAIAVGGVISGVNNLDIRSGRVTRTSLSSSVLQNIQILEYYRSFLIGRIFWNALDCNFIVSGAFGLFRKDVVLSVGGYSCNTVGEDLDLIFKLQELSGNKEKTLFFITDPVCWTETPHTLKGIGTQRNRWQRGMLETLFFHKKSLFFSKNSNFGRIVVPYLWLTEVIFVPAALIGYGLVPVLYLNGLVSGNFFLAFFVLEFLLGLLVSILALIIKEWQSASISIIDILIFLFTAVIEVFGYRQLNFIWRLNGYFDFLRGNQKWGKIQRQGIT